MPSAAQTLRMLENGQYFQVKNKDNGNTDSGEQVLIYPSVIQMLKDAYEASEQGQLALRALGGCLWQLKRSRIDHEIVSMGVFDAYAPPDDHLHDTDIVANDEMDNAAMDVTEDENHSDDKKNKEIEEAHSSNTTSFFVSEDIIDLTSSYHLAGDDDVHNSFLPNHKYLSAIAPVASSAMILDETTLSNLEILQNTFDRSEKRSLWHFINHTLTPGGKRLLKSWLCRPRTMVLTGPNMGGKSTLLRTTCLLKLLGQLGCKIPATSCVFTPVDRIFTRLGASDKLLAGQSTFFVELAETSLLLRASTKHSLCILDELGRGTATFDGTAIAHSVLEYLVSMKKCRVLFATHYHLLVDEWVYDPRVQMGHMDCLVQTKPLPLSDATDVTSSADMVEEVTFLYRLCAGSSPKSYGINVARLAVLPIEVIRMALAEAAKFTQPSLTSSSFSTSTTYPHLPHHHDVRHFAAYRIMTLLLERLVSLAHTHVPSIADHKNANRKLMNKREHDQAVMEMVAHAQELYARYQHLYQHHHIDDLVALP